MPAPSTTTSDAADTRLPSRAWLIVGLLCIVGCLNYLDRVMLTTMRASVTAAITMTDAQFGLLTSAFLWIYGALSPFAGFLADRFSRSRVIIGSLFLWSLTTWLTSHCVTFEQLLTTRILMGISEACYLPAALSLIADYHRGPTRSLAMGIHLCGLSIGSGLGGLGGWLAEHHGWTYAFTLFGSIGVAYSIMLLALLRDAPARLGPQSVAGQPEEKVSFIPALRSLFSQGSFWLLFCYWGLIGVAGWGVIGWMPTYLQQHFNLGQGEAGFSATSYLQITTLLGLIVGGICADRWSLRTERGRIYTAVIGMCIGAPAIFLAASTDTFALAIVGLMLFGLGRGFADCNTMPMLCMVCDTRYRATGFGVLNLFACGVGGLTIYAGGALRDAKVDVSHIFTVAAVGLLVCAVLLSFIKPQTCKTSTPTPL
jgi:MFS family permease